MKIFTVTMAPMNPPYDDAVKNMTFGIAERLRKNEFTFVSAPGRSFPGRANISYVVSPFQKKGRHGMNLVQKTYVFFRMLCGTWKTDVFQLFVTPDAFSSKILSFAIGRSGRKSVQVLSSIHTLDKKGVLGDASKLFFADRTVVYSDFSRNKLEDLGVKNLVRIYPGIDSARFDPSGISEERIFTLGLPKGPEYVLYAGSFSVLADSFPLESYIKIIKEVSARSSNVMFVMAARERSRRDWVMRKRFMENAAAEGVSDKIILLETVDDMPALFASAKMVLVPTSLPAAGVLEMPLVILEAACMSKPVLYGKVHPLEELAEKGIGAAVEGKEPSLYAEKIISILQDRGLCEEIGKRSRRAVLDNFTIDSMASEFDKLYQGL